MLGVAYLMLTFSSDSFVQGILIRERDNATSFTAEIPHCRVIHRIRPTDALSNLNIKLGEEAFRSGRFISAALFLS